jgi:hypothetical protein
VHGLGAGTGVQSIAPPKGFPFLGLRHAGRVKQKVFSTQAIGYAARYLFFVVAQGLREAGGQVYFGNHKA